MRKKSRDVKVLLHDDTYFVRYTNRKKYGKRLAGQFYAPDTTEDEVIEWAKSKGYNVII